MIGTPEAAATLPGHERHHTQDFLCQTGKAFGVADAEAFLKQTLFFENHAQITSTVGSATRKCVRRKVASFKSAYGK